MEAGSTRMVTTSTYPTKLSGHISHSDTHYWSGHFLLYGGTAITDTICPWWQTRMHHSGSEPTENTALGWATDLGILITTTNINKHGKQTWVYPHTINHYFQQCTMMKSFQICWSMAWLSNPLFTPLMTMNPIPNMNYSFSNYRQSHKHIRNREQRASWSLPL